MSPARFVGKVMNVSPQDEMRAGVNALASLSVNAVLSNFLYAQPRL